MTRRIAAAFFFLALALAPLVAKAQEAVEEAPPVIGEVMEVEGAATLQSGESPPQTATADMPVYLGDKIATGADSRVLIVFIDETEITLSDDTQLTIDEYIFDPEDDTSNKAIYSFGRGVFQYVSGLIAKRADPDVTLKTPVGTLGIRGTTVWGGDTDSGAYGVYVEEGFVTVETDAGETLLRQGEGSDVQGRAFHPGPAMAWAPEKLERSRKRLRLKRHDLVRELVRKKDGHRKELRKSFKNFMKKRRERRKWK